MSDGIVSRIWKAPDRISVPTFTGAGGEGGGLFRHSTGTELGEKNSTCTLLNPNSY
jgi:hypothetical protein